MTHKKTILTGVVIVLLVGFYLLGRQGLRMDSNESPSFEFNGRIIEAEIADTTISRTQGLSGRESLEEGTGILFVFESVGQYGFWMKDMNFPIDILWFNEEKELVEVTRGVEPDTYPEVFYPSSPILYALEVNVEEFPSKSLTLGKHFKLSTYKDSD